MVQLGYCTLPNRMPMQTVVIRVVLVSNPANAMQLDRSWRLSAQNLVQRVRLYCYSVNVLNRDFDVSDELNLLKEQA